MRLSSRFAYEIAATRSVLILRARRRRASRRMATSEPPITLCSYAIALPASGGGSTLPSLRHSTRIAPRTHSNFPAAANSLQRLPFRVRQQRRAAGGAVFFRHAREPILG